MERRWGYNWLSALVHTGYATWHDLYSLPHTQFDKPVHLGRTQGSAHRGLSDRSCHPLYRKRPCCSSLTHTPPQAPHESCSESHLDPPASQSPWLYHTYAISSHPWSYSPVRCWCPLGPRLYVTEWGTNEDISQGRNFWSYSWAPNSPVLWYRPYSTRSLPGQRLRANLRRLLLPQSH